MRRRARPPWRDDSRVKTSQNKATQRFDVVRVAILYVTLSGAWLWEHLGSQPETAHHLCYLSVSLPVQSASCSLTVAKKNKYIFLESVCSLSVTSNVTRLDVRKKNNPGWRVRGVWSRGTGCTTRTESSDNQASGSYSTVMETLTPRRVSSRLQLFPVCWRRKCITSESPDY